MLLNQLGYLLVRYLHIVCTTLLVGGTLFYEMVVPATIDDMKQEAQLYLFSKARWVFRWIVWTSAVILLVTGVLSTKRHWQAYKHMGEPTAVATVASDGTSQASSDYSALERPGWWWAAHMSAGFIAILIALSLTAGHTPPARPVAWMRLNLVVLLIVIFLASATRHMRQLGDEQSGPQAPAYITATQ